MAVWITLCTARDVLSLVDQVQAGDQDQDAADPLEDDGALGFLVPVQVPLHQPGAGAGQDDDRAVADAVDERAGRFRRAGRSRPP